MKVNVVGGGPAGLYFAILMKTRNPAHEIAVFERNARDSTFGWGVVFSDRTLSYLQENDARVHEAITRRFRTWDNVDVVHRGQRVTIRGNRFSGIARIELLNILQRRCEELDVALHFQIPIDDPVPLAACDLLVGADGVTSVVKQTYAASFQPIIDYCKNRYIWYGTPQLFHGLTLIFRPNNDGLFIAHAYKFSESCSTFIVECDPQSWERAGFGRLPDNEARAYLEKVFQDDLGGQPLLSNRSKWNRFGVVRSERWHHENVVLLGDALHTAHFSIGSGTKLALEDAVALARSFDAHGDDVSAALGAFEAARRPVVERFQGASLASLAWFEGAAAFLGLDPYEFAYRLMRRSGRVRHEDLDPEFLEAYVRSRIEAAG